MKFHHKFLLYSVILLQFALCEAAPLSIAVIGGGPAGLSAAIQAHLLGANVTVIEKREAYIRNNILFLYGPSLDIFEQWGVEIPQMEILNYVDSRRECAATLRRAPPWSGRDARGDRHDRHL